MLNKWVKKIGFIAIVLSLGLSLNTYSPRDVSAAAAYAYGADISWVPQMEANGYIWKDSNGNTRDIIEILKDKGVNSVRLRTFVNPSNDISKGHCNIYETATLAKRAKDAGLRVIIDFMFGDTFNSKGTQKPPAAWANYNYTQMKQAVNDYVYNSMNVLKTKGVTPDWVQIGNEENLGILGNVGSLAYHPDQMTGLLNAAYNMVKTVSPSTLVMIHLASPQETSSIQNWLDKYKSYGGKWDISAFSSYPSDSAVDGILTNLKNYKTRYGKDVMIVEVGGAVTNPTAAKTMITHMTTGVKNLGGLGTFMWEPEAYWSYRVNRHEAWDKTTFKPTAAMDAFLASGATPL